MIEVKVESIQVSLMTEHRVVLLREVSGERLLPIWIGPYEAEAITLRLRDVKLPRPLTHDLLTNVIAELGGEVSHITVNDLRDNTFYACITVNLDGQQLEIDSRPSDAIALAVRVNASIFVAEEVMAEASIIPEADITEDGDAELAAFREFIGTLDLDDLPLQ